MTLHIDSHVHLVDPTRFSYDWMQGSYSALNHQAGTDDFAPLAAEAGVTGFVAVEATATTAETEWLLELAADVALLRGVVGWVELTADNVHDEIERLKQLGDSRLVSLRHPAQNEPDARWLTRTEVRRGLAAVAAADCSFDLLVTPSQMPAAIELVYSMPELRFVLDHLGKPPLASGRIEVWSDDLRRLAASPNVAAKLSGLVTEADWDSWSLESLRPAVELALSVFGPERLMFGSDWPVASLATNYATVVDTAESLISELSADEQELISHRTAERWYRLIL